MNNNTITNFKKKYRLLKYELRQSRHLIRPYRVPAYIGWLGKNNIGDEIVYHAYKRLFPTLNFTPFSRSKVLEFFRDQTRFLVFSYGSLGGGTLINQDDKWLALIIELLKYKVPVFCFGTGVADHEFWLSHKKDYNNDLSKWADILNQFVFVGVRGPYSKQRLESVGVKNVVILGDTALTIVPPVRNEPYEKNLVGINYGYVKENIIYGDPSQYRENMNQVVRKLISDGYRVKLITVFKKDIPSNVEFCESINHNNLSISTPANYNEFFKEVSSCEIFMGQKLHATIMATICGIPSLMIEYRPKCKDYMASIDMERFNIRTDNFSIDSVFPLVNELIAGRDGLVEKYNHTINKYRNLQKQEAKKVIKILNQD